MTETAPRLQPGSESDKARHAAALAEGYKDEICKRCGAEFLAHIHFIRCDNSPCPMKSKSDPRSLFEKLADMS